MSVGMVMDDFNAARAILLDTAQRHIQPALEGGGDMDAQATRMLLAFLAMGAEFNGGKLVDYLAVRQARFVSMQTFQSVTSVYDLPTERVLTGFNVLHVMPHYYKHMVPVHSTRHHPSESDWIIHDTAFDTPILTDWTDHTQQLRVSYFMTEKPVNNAITRGKLG